MKMNATQGQPEHSIAREHELLRRLDSVGVCCTDELRLTIADHELFLDGFVESLDEKLRVEQVCHELTPGITVVNRLRVADDVGHKVS
jgi:hypothetical protein